MAASLGGQGKHSAHRERMEATVSWKLDKGTFVFSSLVWFSVVTLLSLPGKCPQTQQRTLCFFLGSCTGLLQSPTRDILNQSPDGSTWIHTNYGSGWRELSCSCFSRLYIEPDISRSIILKSELFINKLGYERLNERFFFFFFFNRKT